MVPSGNSVPYLPFDFLWPMASSFSIAGSHPSSHGISSVSSLPLFQPASHFSYKEPCHWVMAYSQSVTILLWHSKLGLEDAKLTYVHLHRMGWLRCGYRTFAWLVLNPLPWVKDFTWGVKSHICEKKRSLTSETQVQGDNRSKSKWSRSLVGGPGRPFSP